MKFVRLQYSLRTFLVAVILFAAAMGIFSWRMRQAQTQRKAINDIATLLRPNTGTVYYDYQYSPLQENNGSLSWPEWQIENAKQPRDLGLGIDFWHRPMQAEFSDYDGYGPKADGLFDLLSQLPSLRHFVFRDETLDFRGKHFRQLARKCNVQTIVWYGSIRDDAFSAIGDCSQLRAIYMEDDEQGYLRDVNSWHVLAKLSHLREFHASNGPVPDEAAVALSKCPGLWSLSLSDGEITDQGAQAIARLRELHCLFLSGNKVTSEGTKDWGSLTRLKTLRLDHNPVDDRTLHVLSRLSELRELHLAEDQLTGAALTLTGAFPALEELWIGSSKLEPEAWKSLSRMPHLKLLSIDGTGTIPLAVAGERGFENLETLYMDGAKLTPDAWQAICQLPSTSGMQIIRAGNLDAAFFAQQEPVSIKNLILQECQLSREALLHLLSKLPALQSIQLFRNNLTQADINAARQVTSARIEGFPEPYIGHYK